MNMPGFRLKYRFGGDVGHYKISTLQGTVIITNLALDNRAGLEPEPNLIHFLDNFCRVRTDRVLRIPKKNYYQLIRQLQDPGDHLAICGDCLEQYFRITTYTE